MADKLYCSFCGKSQDEVRKLIAGPQSFICNECVELFVNILIEDGTGVMLKNSRNNSPIICMTIEELEKVVRNALKQEPSP